MVLMALCVWLYCQRLQRLTRLRVGLSERERTGLVLLLLLHCKNRCITRKHNIMLSFQGGLTLQRTLQLIIFLKFYTVSTTEPLLVTASPFTTTASPSNREGHTWYITRGAVNSESQLRRYLSVREEVEQRGRAVRIDVCEGDIYWQRLQIT